MMELNSQKTCLSPPTSLVLRRALLSVLAAAFVFSTAAFASADAKIRYQFKVGETTKWVMTQSVTMNMKLPQGNQNIVTTMNQQMYLQTMVDEVLEDGSARMRQVINRIIMKTKNEGLPGGNNFEYDSSSEEKPTGPVAEILLKSLQPMIGAEWKQTMSPTGEVSNIEVPERVVESLKANPAAAMMGNLGTAEGLKQISSQGAMVFPVEPLTVGKTWDSQIDMKMPFGTMSTKKIMKYLGPTEDQKERLGMQTELSFQADPNSAVKLSVSDNQSEGEVLFDNQRGRLERSKLHQVTTMQVNAGGQNIDQVVTTDVLFELDKTPATRE